MSQLGGGNTPVQFSFKPRHRFSERLDKLHLCKGHKFSLGTNGTSGFFKQLWQHSCDLTQIGRLLIFVTRFLLQAFSQRVTDRNQGLRF